MKRAHELSLASLKPEIIIMHLKTNAFSNEVKVHIQEDRLAEEIERSLIF